MDFPLTADWPHARMTLAQLLPKAGHSTEAAVVEAEILHYFSEADSDYWVLAKLRRR